MRGGRRRVDATQAAIVEALRAAGCSVLCIHHVGHGAPDLVVGWGLRVVFLLECKSPGGDLTLDERRWNEQWRGPPLDVVYGAEEALATLHRHIKRGVPV